jgi:hypothetical protein
LLFFFNLNNYMMGIFVIKGNIDTFGSLGGHWQLNGTLIGIYIDRTTIDHTWSYHDWSHVIVPQSITLILPRSITLIIPRSITWSCVIDRGMISVTDRATIMCDGSLYDLIVIDHGTIHVIDRGTITCDRSL